MNLNQWKNSTLKNHVKKHKPPQAEVDHVLDFLKNHPQEKLCRASYPQILAKSIRWTTRLNKKKVTQAGEVDILIKGKKYNLVQLKDHTAFAWEGKKMGHCVLSYFEQGSLIYSIRDQDNIPHVTIEIQERTQKNLLVQAQGQDNAVLPEKYYEFFISAAEKMNWEISESTLETLGFSKSPDLDLDLYFKNPKYKKINNQNYIDIKKSNLDPVKSLKCKNARLLKLLIKKALTGKFTAKMEKGIIELFKSGTGFNDQINLLQRLLSEYQVSPELMALILKKHSRLLGSYDLDTLIFILNQMPELVINLIRKNNAGINRTTLQSVINGFLSANTKLEAKALKLILKDSLFDFSPIINNYDFDFLDQHYPQLAPIMRDYKYIAS